MGKIKSLTDADLTELQANGKMTILGHEITVSEVMLKYDVEKGKTVYETHSENNVCFIYLTIK